MFFTLLFAGRSEKSQFLKKLAGDMKEASLPLMVLDYKNLTIFVLHQIETL
jgi:hypothetical protein